MSLGKVWRTLGRAGLVIGLVADLLNLWPLYRVLTNEPPGVPVVFENFRVNALPDCAFETRLQDEAEPAFVWNLLDGVPGIGSAEESAYAKAEYKIWKNLAGGGPSSVEVSSFARGYSSEEMMKIHREMVDERGLQYIHKKFYFDRNGYHAQLVMGKPRATFSTIQHSGCAVDSDRGQSEHSTRSVSFTCANLEEVIARQVERIMSANTPRRCWVSYSYTTDFQAGRVKFNEEYFVINQEESYDAGWPAL
jgi:hypothetical protein